MQTCVIFNPSARGQKAEVCCALVESLFPQCSLRRTHSTGHARELAQEAVCSGFQKIIAAGGDGTVNEVLNGVADAPGGLESTVFGVLPLGTINVFAREIGLPRALKQATAILLAGKTRTIDLGLAEYTSHGAPRKRYFIQLAGAGLDSRAIELVSWEMKKKLGALAYIVAGCRALGESRPVITVDGDQAVSGELVLIGNGRFYGGSLAMFPAASLADGLLDFCVLPKVNWFEILAAAPGLLTGHFRRLSSARHFRRPSVRLTSDRRVLVQLDGENSGELPVTLSVCPKALRVVVP